MPDRLALPHILDNPAWASLSGPHSHFSQNFGSAKRYPRQISPFTALDNIEEAQSWTDFAKLIAIGIADPNDRIGVLIRRSIVKPSGWEEVFGGTGLQMTGEFVEGEIDDEVIDLGDVHVPQMIDLVARTEPGPFEPRTIELGGYVGFFENEKLIAMAGCRMRPTGWREISAVCTDPDFRGRGLAARLVKTIVARVRQEGEIPFLHASETNLNAIALYERLGFRVRSTMQFAVLQQVQ